MAEDVEIIPENIQTKPPFLVVLDNLPKIGAEQVKDLVTDQYALISKHLGIYELSIQRNWYYDEENNKIVIMIQI